MYEATHSSEAVSGGAKDGGVPELIPARMLNEYVYCPRLFYLEWVQGEFEDSADTIQGRFRHRNVHREVGGEDTNAVGCLPEEPIHMRSLMLGADREGLIARVDLVEVDGRKAVPIDYKRGLFRILLNEPGSPNGYSCVRRR